MKIRRQYAFQAPRSQLWSRLLDPDFLRESIPGCERLIATTENTYEVTLSVGVSVVRGRFTGVMKMLDIVEPESFRLVIEGRGTSGSVRGEAFVTMEERGQETTVDVKSEAQVGGVLARFGQRALAPVGAKLMDRFFAHLQPGPG